MPKAKSIISSENTEQESKLANDDILKDDEYDENGILITSKDIINRKK